MPGDFAAIILAGGAGRRIGGPHKPALRVGGASLLERVLAAVAQAQPRVVVGPPDLPLPAGVLRIQENPPGAGPVAALAAGLTLTGAASHTAVLAADFPFLTPAAVTQLRTAAEGGDGALYVDGDGRRQLLCGVWRTESLREALPAELAGAAMRRLLDGLRVVEVGYEGDGPPPWYDCDTPEDLDRAEGWAR